jgi:hypothetical protein
MNDLSAVETKDAFARPRFRYGLIPLLCLYIVTCCISLAFVAISFSDVVAFDDHHLFAPLLIVACFSIVAILFAIARFSFGYFLGFYFYTMILGYLWLIEFSKTSYNHSLAIVSIFLSALAFLAPALFITSPINRRFSLPVRTFEALLSLILIVATATVVVGALYNFKIANLADMYKFRAGLQFPGLLRYSIGMTSVALLPFAFACFVERGNRWRAAIVLLLIPALPDHADQAHAVHTVLAFVPVVVIQTGDGQNIGHFVLVPAHVAWGCVDTGKPGELNIFATDAAICRHR